MHEYPVTLIILIDTHVIKAFAKAYRHCSETSRAFLETGERGGGHRCMCSQVIFHGNNSNFDYAIAARSAKLWSSQHCLITYAKAEARDVLEHPELPLDTPKFGNRST